MNGSLARQYPFGAYGTTPATTITDRGYTGHRENRDLGLTYMNARYYVVGLGRFASADALVPDLMNPQSFNRYSYPYNSPTNFTDPSGHDAWWCGGNATCQTPYYASMAANANCSVGCWLDQWYGGATEVGGALEDSILAASMIVDQVDWVTTGFQCLTEGCTLPMVGFAALPVVTGAMGRWGDDLFSLADESWDAARSLMDNISRAADRRVANWGIEGTYDAARASSRSGNIVLPGLFRYGDNMKGIAGYQRHHLWPEALGGPRDGWAV